MGWLIKNENRIFLSVCLNMGCVSSKKYVPDGVVRGRRYSYGSCYDCGHGCRSKYATLTWRRGERIVCKPCVRRRRSKEL